MPVPPKARRIPSTLAITKPVYFTTARTPTAKISAAVSQRLWIFFPASRYAFFSSRESSL